MTSGVHYMAAYFLLFAAVHSLLADPGFKSPARAALGGGYDRWQRLGYNMLAIFMVLPFLFLLVFLPGRVVYSIPPPWNWAMMAGQMLAAWAALATLRSTGVSSFLGLDHLQRKGAGSGGQADGRARRLVTDGFYGRVRHPLYVSSLLFLWLIPIMTESLLAFNICATLYFILGARHEERSLVMQFGSEYEEYRRSVPMFLPRLRPIKKSI